MQDREQQHIRVLKQEKENLWMLMSKKKPRGREEGQHIRPKTLGHKGSMHALKAKNMHI